MAKKESDVAGGGAGAENPPKTEAAPKKKGGKPAPEAKAAPPAEGRPPAEAAVETAPKTQSKPKVKKAEAGDQPLGQKKARGRSMRGRSKRHRENLKKVDRHKAYPLDEAVRLLKQLHSGPGNTKFVSTVNIVLNLGIDPKHAEQMIRGAVSLPKGIGKTKRVIAFCDGDDAAKAKAAGAIEADVDDLVKKVSDGWLDFDVAIAHPRAMGKVGKLGRVLGPQGKMPTPKNGTVTADIETAVREFAAGKIEFRNDTGANVHAIVGKVNFSEADLKENILAFIDHIKKMKPSSSKGTYLKKVCISGTMSPAIEVQVAQ